MLSLLDSLSIAAVAAGQHRCGICILFFLSSILAIVLVARYCTSRSLITRLSSWTDSACVITNTIDNESQRISSTAKV